MLLFEPFGATSVLGCIEAAFSLKTMLQARREHVLDSCVLLVDLIKSHDSLKNKIIHAALKKMGSAQNHFKWAEKLHSDYNVVWKLEKKR